ncbi:MAG: PIN domain-containing protein [Syntrophobacteraceae bacterium]|jgi:tRNA(fMet)-specific endonuclease VapC
MRYVLDTNILSELLKKRPNPHLIARLRSKQPGALFTSCICVMELRFGAALRGDAEIFWEKITEEILSKVTILLIGSLEAVTAGDLLASFQKAGQIIGMEDILIASTALSQKCIMVTANTRHFSRVESLSVENWLEPM